MITIGDFARLGLVSVRMLRHYDTIGLLEPAAVDPSNGYRHYDLAQLGRLHRICALKELGFGLDQVRAILDDELSAEQLRGMLRLRRAEIAERIAADSDRLGEVERRLRSIEKEGTMPSHDIIVKPVAATPIVCLRASVESAAEIGPVIGPLFARLAQRLSSAIGHVPQTSLATYAVDHDGAMLVTAAMPYAGPPLDGLLVDELTAESRVATVVHHGSMDTIRDSWEALMRWVQEAGLTPTGVCREVYLNTSPLDDQSGWVTELQQPVR